MYVQNCETTSIFCLLKCMYMYMNIDYYAVVQFLTKLQLSFFSFLLVYDIVNIKM